MSNCNHTATQNYSCTVESDSHNSELHSIPLPSTSTLKGRSAGVPSIAEESTVSDIAPDLESNTIDDTSFFPDLSALFTKTAQGLRKLVALEQQADSPAASDQPATTDACTDAEAEAYAIEKEESPSPSPGSSPALSPNEQALMKGMSRRSWTGPPWLDAITADSSTHSLSAAAN